MTGDAPVQPPPSTFATALAELGATGRAVASLAAPIGEPVYVPEARRRERTSPIINITINVTSPKEE